MNNLKNRRNGHSKKTIKGEFGEAEIAVPRDRNGEFEPLIVKKGQTRFNGFIVLCNTIFPGNWQLALKYLSIDIFNWRVRLGLLVISKDRK